VITLDKLRLYRKLSGDSDAWSRNSRAGNQVGMTAQDWSSIDRILQSLTITENGLATPEFGEQTHRNLGNLAGSDEVRTALIAMAKARSIR
jgi:hypothetical protein